MPMKNYFPVRTLFISITALIIAGCAATVPIVREKLDPLTGVTVTFSNTPLIMYRDDSGRAAYARNYVHMGPVRVNRSGSYQYYLWLSAWNTMQSVGPAEHQDSLESIVLFVDGEPMSLDLVGWTPEAIGTSEPVYLKPVASSVDAYYRVTADQIRLIAESTDLTLRTSGLNAREFNPWENQQLARSELLEFLNKTFF
jgi:hypothetical protein